MWDWNKNKQDCLISITGFLEGLLTLCVCVCVCVCLSLSLSLSVSVSVCLSVCVSVCYCASLHYLYCRRSAVIIHAYKNYKKWTLSSYHGCCYHWNTFSGQLYLIQATPVSPSGRNARHASSDCTPSPLLLVHISSFAPDDVIKVCYLFSLHKKHVWFMQ
jgi:hypothetical protein